MKVRVDEMKTFLVAGLSKRLFFVGLSFIILTASIASLVSVASAASSQSGRRKTDPSRQSPVPQPTPTPEEQGESESQPRSTRSNDKLIVATFVVCEDENVSLDFTLSSNRDFISAEFFQRLKRSSLVSVERGGKATRGGARDRAKKEHEAHVVLLQLEEDRMAPRSRDRRQTGGADPAAIAIRLYVYSPVTGDLKFTDVVTQRPYRPTTSIGGVRVPIPVGRPERYPGEQQLAQAARDAADRLLAKFNIAAPPDN
jgi:hypothetical protein